jgi:ribulose-phosphate 3-epimerase
MNNIIAASILSADLSKLAHDIQQCEQAGVNWIHVDVMDGHFVPNLTMGPVIVQASRSATQLPLDCHLMVEKPETLVQAFSLAGASILTIHPENNPNIHRTLQLIRDLGVQPGVALNPGTPAELIAPLLPFVDLVLVMTVNPGYSGQAFIPEMLAKVGRVAELIRQADRPIRLEVDGGVIAANISQLCKAGADTFVSASSIFTHPGGIATGVVALREALG